MHENDKYPGVPERIQLMDENGTVHEHPTYSRYIEDVNADTLREAYRLMYTTRRFDDEATALQRQGPTVSTPSLWRVAWTSAT